MDNRWLFVKLFLVICLIGVVIGADKVKKRDVHHMIVVRGARKPRSNRHTHHHHPHHKHRGKRHRHHHHHHRHHLHDDSVEDGSSLYDSHEYSYEDTSKYQPHRHKSKHHSHHYDSEESQLGDDLTPPISLDIEDFHYKQPKHKYKKRHSNKQKKRHNNNHNHRNRYNDAPKFPQIDLTTSYPIFYENFPPYDAFGSFNQKFIDSDRSPIIKTDGLVLNPDLLKLDNNINRYEVKENVNENMKNQSSFQILAPIFNADNLSTEETKTEKTVEDRTPVTPTTRRPRIRSRGNVKPRKNSK